MILIPKTGVPQDVYAIDMLVTQIEQYKKREKKIGFELLIETALGMANVEAIAQSSKRVEAMSFGVADYAASTRARTMGIGAPHPDYGILSDKDGDKPREFYWNDPWHYALSRMMVACRASGFVAGGAGRQGRGVARRPPDRHRLDPPGRGSPQQGSRHGDVVERSSSEAIAH